jgi:hypothetical protein
VIYGSGPVIYGSGQMIYRCRQVIYRSRQVIYLSGHVIYGSGQVIYLSGQVIYRSSQVIYARGRMIYRTGVLLGIDRSRSSTLHFANTDLSGRGAVRGGAVPRGAGGGGSARVGVRTATDDRRPTHEMLNVA